MFVDGLTSYPAAIVARVCETLGYEPPGEYEPRFPPLHVIRARCQQVVDRQREASAVLPAAALDARYPPLDPARHAAIMAQFRALCREKSWR
ncbi:MAG: hypothetical protein OEW98_00140 [Betaproteobacteria bacterium]|nr:hypothetical protein [Betaproteobacteria bacterium]